MKVMVTSEDRSVHNDVLDDQHTHLIDLMNLACENASDYNICFNILEQIYDEMKHHFETENRLMEQSGYQNIKLHVIEHHRILNKLMTLLNNYDNHYYGIVYIIDTLMQTIVDHIDNYDMDYVQCVSEYTQRR